MDIKPIKTEKDYDAALKEIEKLLDSEPGTEQGDRLQIVSTLVEAYEDEYYDIPAPDPIEAINYFMESRGLTRADLEPYIGSRARVSEILNRKRPLTLSMIQRLHVGLGIPAEMLVRTYKIITTGKPSHRTSISA
jgi:HTH-type transcriptional regulator / antitoxin HigA